MQVIHAGASAEEADTLLPVTNPLQILELAL